MHFSNKNIGNNFNGLGNISSDYKFPVGAILFDRGHNNYPGSLNWRTETNQLLKEWI